MPINMKFRFKGRKVALAATVFVTVLGILLGNWQTHRGDAKEAMQTQMAARQAAPAVTLDDKELQLDVVQGEYRRVRLQGQFVASWTTYLDNRPYNDVPGLYVLTPFKIAGAQRVVLVERGWIARDLNDRSKVPSFSTPDEMVTIEGIIRIGAGHVLQLGSAEAIRPGTMMQNLDIAAYAKASGMPLLPFVIEQQAGGTHYTGDSLVRDWPAPALGVERNRGYAVQWYALALMAVIFFVVTGFRSGKK